MDEHEVSVTLQQDPNGDNHVALLGVLDLFAVEKLREQALRCVDSGRRTVVDCAKLERIDASALQLLIAMERELRSRGATLALAGVPEKVSRYLGLSGARSLQQTPGSDAAPTSCLTEPNLGTTSLDRAAAGSPGAVSAGGMT